MYKKILLASISLFLVVFMLAGCSSSKRNGDVVVRDIELGIDITKDMTMSELRSIYADEYEEYIRDNGGISDTIGRERPNLMFTNYYENEKISALFLPFPRCTRFEINGVKIGSSEEDLIQILGEPDKEEEKDNVKYLTYNFKSSTVVFDVYGSSVGVHEIRFDK